MSGPSFSSTDAESPIRENKTITIPKQPIQWPRIQLEHYKESGTYSAFSGAFGFLLLLSSEAQTLNVTICAQSERKKSRNFHFVAKNAVYKGPFIEYLKVFNAFSDTNISNWNLELIGDPDRHATFRGTI